MKNTPKMFNKCAYLLSVRYGKQWMNTDNQGVLNVRMSDLLNNSA